MDRERTPGGPNRTIADKAGAIPRSADIVIVGAGVIGASIAYHLSQKGGTDIVIFEKEELPGMGSTSKACGGIRAQFGTEINIQLSLKSMELLESLDEDMKAAVKYIKLGYLFMTAQKDNWQNLRRLAALQKKMGVEVEFLSREEIRQKAPYVVYNDLLGGTFGTRDGFVDAAGMTNAYLSRALQSGARLFLKTEVTGIRKAGQSIKGVTTTRGEINCERVINAAGPYAGKVAGLAGVDIPVAPVRRHVALSGPVNFLPRVIPMTIDSDSGLLVRREGGAIAMACADSREKPGFEMTVDEEFFSFIGPKVHKRFPVLEQVGLDRKKSWAGLYEVTPDNHPVLGDIEDVHGLYLANGFSGHGVMHSPAVGLVMSELVLGGKAETLDIGPLGIGRFKQGKLLVEKAVL